MCAVESKSRERAGEPQHAAGLSIGKHFLSPIAQVTTRVLRSPALLNTGARRKKKGDQAHFHQKCRATGQACFFLRLFLARRLHSLVRTRPRLATPLCTTSRTFFSRSRFRRPFDSGDRPSRFEDRALLEREEPASRTARSAHRMLVPRFVQIGLESKGGVRRKSAWGQKSGIPKSSRSAPFVRG